MLWTLFTAPAIAFGMDPSHFTQVAGAILSVGLMIACFVYTEKRLGGGWYSLVTPVFLAFNLAYVMESLSGLETLAFSVLVFVAYVTFLEERRSASRRPGMWAAWCGAATLLRPEGLLVFGVLAAFALVVVLRGEPAGRSGAPPDCTPCSWHRLRVATRLLRRLLPNTFYTKVGYTSAQLNRGWRYWLTPSPSL